MKTKSYVYRTFAVFMIAMLAMLALPASPARAAAATTCTSVAATAWATASTWSCTGAVPGAHVPGATDDVVIATNVSVGSAFTQTAGLVTVNNGSTLTFTAVGTFYNLTINGTLVDGGRTHLMNGTSFILNGTWTGIGQLRPNNAATTINGTGSMGVGARLRPSAAMSLTIAPTANLTFDRIDAGAATTVTNNGTVTIGGGGITGGLSGAGSSWTNAAGSTLVLNTAAVNAGNAWSLITNNGTLNLNGTGSIPAITNDATGTLNISSTLAIFTLKATAAGNTVNYTGAAQTGKVTTFYNLTLSGSGVKTFANTTTVNGVLSLEETATITVTSGTTGVVKYGPNATLQYNKPDSYSATDEEWKTPFAGTGGVIVKNTGVITPGARNITNNLEIGTDSVVNISNAMTANTLSFAGAPQAYGTWSAAGATNNDAVRFLGSTANLTVFKKKLTISGLTGVNKVYDATTTAAVTGTAALVGVLPADVANVTLLGSPTAVFADKNAGTSKLITVSGYSLSGSASGNYLLSQPSLTANITAKGLTVSGITASNKTFDATTSATINTASAALIGNLDGGNVTLDATGASGVFTPNGNAGTNKTVQISGLTVGGSASGNYSLTQPTATANIDPLNIAVTADSKTKVYGDSDPTFSYTNDVLLGGGSFSGVLNRASGKNVGLYAINIGTLTAGSNYHLVFTSNNMSITQRAITVTAATDSKVYDGSTTSSGVPTVGTLQFSDTPNFTQTFNNKNTGTGKTLIPTGTVNDGNGGNNYSITFVNNTTGEITAADVTVTADDKAISVGDADPTFTFSDSGFVSPDTFTTLPTCSVSATHTTAGTYDIDCSGGDAGTNYTISYVAGTLTVSNKIILQVATDNKTITYGDSAPSFSPIITGFEVPDTIAVLDTLPTCSATGPFTHVASPFAITCSGGFDDKYAFNYTSGSLTVDPLAVTATADAQTKVYGASDPAFTYTVSPDLVGSDSFSGALTKSGEDVGIQAITQGTLQLSGNYTLSYVGADLTITKADLTVTANNKTKWFGFPDPAFTITYTGLKNGDAGSVIDTAPTCGVTGAHTAVGTYPIVCSGGSDNNYNLVTPYVDGTLTVKALLVKSITSTGSQDGWILESSEASNIGGLFNAAEKTFPLGDNAADKQYKAILSFNTASLPDNAIITKVVLKIKQSGQPVGINPFSVLGGLLVDIRKGSFGTAALQATDFQTVPSLLKAGTFNKTPAAGWYSVTLSVTGRSKVNKIGLTQLRLRFTKDDNDDRFDSYMKFFSGNNATGKPILIITYKLP